MFRPLLDFGQGSSAAYCYRTHRVCCRPTMHDRAAAAKQTHTIASTLLSLRYTVADNQLLAVNHNESQDAKRTKHAKRRDAYATRRNAGYES